MYCNDMSEENKSLSLNARCSNIKKTIKNQKQNSVKEGWENMCF